MQYALLSVAFHGILWLILLFLLSFALVHVIKLALIGWNAQKKKNEPPPKKQPPAPKPEPTSPPEPIYYIVEKRQRRPKTNYGEPKQINFK